MPHRNTPFFPAGITERDLRPGAQLGRERALAKTILAAEKVLDY